MKFLILKILTIGLLAFPFSVHCEILKESFQRLDGLAASGNTKAQLKLGVMLLVGNEVPQDKDAGLKWITKAAESGSADAQNELYAIYRGGFLGIDANPAKTVTWCRKSAEQGNLTGMYNLSRLLAEGLSIEKAPKKSKFWLTKSRQAVLKNHLERVTEEVEKHIATMSKPSSQAFSGTGAVRLLITRSGKISSIKFGATHTFNIKEQTFLQDALQNFKTKPTSSTIEDRFPTSLDVTITFDEKSKDQNRKDLVNAFLNASVEHLTKRRFERLEEEGEETDKYWYWMLTSRSGGGFVLVGAAKDNKTIFLNHAHLGIKFTPEQAKEYNKFIAPALGGYFRFRPGAKHPFNGSTGLNFILTLPIQHDTPAENLMAKVKTFCDYLDVETTIRKKQN